MDSTPSELLHRYKGFGYVGILGDEESGEMKSELLWVEDMRRYFGKICNLRVGTQTKYRKNWVRTIGNILDYRGTECRWIVIGEPQASLTRIRGYYDRIIRLSIAEIKRKVSL